MNSSPGDDFLLLLAKTVSESTYLFLTSCGRQEFNLQLNSRFIWTNQSLVKDESVAQSV